jgi:hypothetical protein
VSVFRPFARVTDPHGRAWEIYAFRILLPERSAGDSPLEYQIDLFSQVIGGIFWLVRGAFVQVLAQVEGGIARGEVPMPRNAQLVRGD